MLFVGSFEGLWQFLDVFEGLRRLLVYKLFLKDCPKFYSGGFGFFVTISCHLLMPVLFVLRSHF